MADAHLADRRRRRRRTTRARDRMAGSLAQLSGTPARLRPSPSIPTALSMPPGTSTTRRGFSNSWHGLPPADSDSRVLGITGLDLYVPVLTFVFGEAQMHRPLRPGLLPPAARGVLRPAAAPRPPRGAPGQGGDPRAGPHFRAAALPQLGLRDGLDPLGRAPRPEEAGFLPRLPQGDSRD